MTKRILAAIMAFVLIFSCMPVLHAHADDSRNSSGTTYYVSSLAGKDSNTGTSQDSPFASPQENNDSNLQSGDQVQVEVQLVVGETAVFTDETGNYVGADTSALDSSVATVALSAAPSDTKTLSNAVIALESGKQYLLVNNRAGKPVTNQPASAAAAAGAGSGLSLQGAKEDVEDAAIWTITGSNGTYTVQDSAGQYMTVGANSAGLTSSASQLSLAYNGSAWTIAQNGAYLNHFGGSSSTCAAGWQDTSAAADSGSQWDIYEVLTAVDENATQITFTGVNGGETYVQIGDVVYHVTVTGTGCTHANTEVRNAADATCSAAGSTGETWCLDCGAKIAEGTELPVTDHNYVNGFCAYFSTHYEPATDADNDGVYEIANGGQLYWFAKLVDEGTLDADAVLTADITVNENVLVDGALNADGDFRTWNAIGANAKKYGGTFDGQNHTVSGLYYDKDSTVGGYVGLVASLSADGVVQNVTVTGSYICGYRYIGAVVGQNVGGLIQNCANGGSVITASGSYIGGVVGGNSGTVTGCTNSGTVSSGEGNNVGGIAGGNSGTVSLCYNTGSVLSECCSDEHCLGGVVGLNEDGTIRNCYNAGSVTSDGAATGGIVGKTDEGTLENCHNVGAVSGATYAGGIIGRAYNDPAVTGCYYMSACALDGKSVAQNGHGSATKGSATADTDGYIVKTAAVFASGEIAYLLNGSTSEGELVWFQTIGTDAYPKLAGEIVYFDANAAQRYYNIVHNHTFDQQVATDKYIAVPATCSEPAAYYYSCSCGEAGTETFSGTELGEHNYVNGFCTIVGTHYEPAVLNSSNVYEISNGGQLYWFAELVNSGENEAETANTDVYNAVLTADITINPGTFSASGDYTAVNGESCRAWNPIGYYTSTSASLRYSGTFDGQGHTISGLYFNKNNVEYVGLFGYLDGNGTVKNVNLVNSFINGMQNVGGIVGYNEGGKVMDCSNAAYVTTTAAESYNGQHIGGVVGFDCDGTIENCSNRGTVTGKSNVGGVLGYEFGNAATITGCYNTGAISSNADASTSHNQNVGGVAGYTKSSITDCYNMGTVTAARCVGGIVGSTKGSASGMITISSCYNTGAVTANSTYSGAYYAGGIVGCDYSGTTITECHNTAAIQANISDVGGILGGVPDTYPYGSYVNNCYNTGSVTGLNYVGGIIGDSNTVVSDCYNIGTVHGTRTDKFIFVGAVVGCQSKNREMTNCYYLEGCATDANGNAQNGIGNTAMGVVTEDTENVTTAKSLEQFASGEVCHLLNGSISEGDLVWFQTIGTDASPKFEGQVVYAAFASCHATAGVVFTNDASAGTSRPDHTWAERVDEKYLVTDTDCENAAVYYKSCSVCGEAHETETFTSGDALGHAYGEPVIVWNEDNTASATVTCATDASHVLELEVTVTSATTEGDCETKAVTTYTATVTFQGETYTSTKTVEGELGECADKNNDHKCDVCEDVLSECVDENKDYKCDICGAELEKPVADSVIRLAGAHRWATSLMVADEMKANLGVEKFGSIIIASGNDFADALAGSYLSTVKSAPILLSWGRGGNFEYLDTDNIEYIKANLAEGGTVYILGGTNAVPELYEDALDVNVKRLGGADRFETNLLILAEAGVKEGSEILVCTSTNFADSLSASATGKPVLLVFNELGKLYGAQPEYLAKLQNCTFTVIGGESAVSADLAKAIEAYGTTTRLAGTNRFETSVLVAEKYFENPETAVLAYAWNYPDGLCGGSLAFSLKAPLVLTMTKYEGEAVEYATGNSITTGIVLGGDGLISDDAVRDVFDMDADDEIMVK